MTDDVREALAEVDGLVDVAFKSGVQAGIEIAVTLGRTPFPHEIESLVAQCWSEWRARNERMAS